MEVDRRAVLNGMTMAAGLAAAPGLAFGPSPVDTIRGHKLRRIATGRVIHRFFDTSPISPSGRYVALVRLPYEGRSPVAGDACDVVLVDLRTGTERVVARSRGWEMQLGAQLQWGASDRQLFFNDVDPQDWRAFAVVLDPVTGAQRRLGGPLFMASADGTRLVGYDLVTSRYAQVGYGVIVPDAVAKRRLGPQDDNGVFVTDVATGRSRLVASSRRIFEEAKPSIRVPDPERFEFYVFQAKWNPQGTHILVSYQWSNATTGRARAVIAMRADGSDIRTLVTPAQWARGGHHMNWAVDGGHVTMNLNVDDRPGLELISAGLDRGPLQTIFRPGSGHPSQHPRGLPLMITDSYPDEPVAKGDGTVPLRLLNLNTGTERRVAEVYVSTTGGEHRIDPHPAWDRTGRYVTFNGFVGETRNVWMLDLKDLVEEAAGHPLFFDGTEARGASARLRNRQRRNARGRRR